MRKSHIMLISLIYNEIWHICKEMWSGLLEKWIKEIESTQTYNTNCWYVRKTQRNQGSTTAITTKHLYKTIRMEESIELGNHFKNNSHLFGERKYEFRYSATEFENWQVFWKREIKSTEKTFKSIYLFWVISASLGIHSQENLPMVLEHNIFVWPLLQFGFMSLSIPILQVRKTKPREDDTQKFPQWVSDKPGSDLLDFNFVIIAQAENI